MFLVSPFLLLCISSSVLSGRENSNLSCQCQSMQERSLCVVGLVALQAGCWTWWEVRALLSTSRGPWPGTGARGGWPGPGSVRRTAGGQERSPPAPSLSPSTGQPSSLNRTLSTGRTWLWTEVSTTTDIYNYRVSIRSGILGKS